MTGRARPKFLRHRAVASERKFSVALLRCLFCNTPYRATLWSCPSCKKTLPEQAAAKSHGLRFVKPAVPAPAADVRPRPSRDEVCPAPAAIQRPPETNGGTGRYADMWFALIHVLMVALALAVYGLGLRVSFREDGPSGTWYGLKVDRPGK